MALSLFTKTKKAITERAQDDYATKMRLKYKPYYSTAIYTVNVTLDRDKDGIACERS